MMEWQNGTVLVLEGLNKKQIRCLVQDGHLTVQADGVVLNPQLMRLLSQALAQGSEVLTQG